MHQSLDFPAQSSRQAAARRPGPVRGALRRARRGALPAALLAAWLALPAPVAAQDRAQPAVEYHPEVGQAGKDVVWVPTPQELVDKMLDIAHVTPDDYLMDLGSGDGRTVITAARRGLTAQGIEYNPDMAELARRNAAQAGVGERATFVTGDLFEADLTKADVITMFLLPSINERLRPIILDLKPGTRVVSNSFPMGDWQPDETATVGGECRNWCTALLWIVPAKVAGNWQLDGQDLKLEQSFQMLSGTLGGAAISDARLLGDEIAFSANGARYTGKVQGKTMSGSVAGGQGGNWSARQL